MHLAYAFLNLESHPNLLVFSKLDYRDTNLFLLIDSRVKLNWQHGAHLFILALDLIENRADTHRSDFHDLLAGVFGFQHEVGLAALTVFHRFLCTAAGPRVLIVVYSITNEGD